MNSIQKEKEHQRKSKKCMKLMKIFSSVTEKFLNKQSGRPAGKSGRPAGRPAATAASAEASAEHAERWESFRVSPLFSLFCPLFRLLYSLISYLSPLFLLYLLSALY